MTTQDNWRLCTACCGLFWSGYPTSGACAAGGSHRAFRSYRPADGLTGWEYTLRVASTGQPPKLPGAVPLVGPAQTQNNWRFCTKCYVLFFYGFFNVAGVCPQDRGHSPFQSASPSYAATSWDYVLQVASTAPPPRSPGPASTSSSAGMQNNWRSCTKCYGLFYYGFADFAGTCPQGGRHSPRQSATHVRSSWDYALPISSSILPDPLANSSIEIEGTRDDAEVFDDRDPYGWRDGWARREEPGDPPGPS